MRSRGISVIAGIALFFFSSLLIGGCGPKTRLVLLPNPDGTVGQIEVSTLKGTQTIARAWHAVEVAKADADPGPPVAMEEEEVRTIFKEALEAQPQVPVTFLLYFHPESFRPTAKSLQVLPEVLQAIEERRSNDISVIGHTDLVGAPDYNMDLSLKRAKRVARILITNGVDPVAIEIDYFGKEKPLVRTSDGVPEPRNRRVEITVR
jgi:outer membrane protein OmpA-like peptidoglycan-associated protein